MNQKTKKNKSLLFKFGIMFGIFILITLLMNGIYTYYVQMQTYHQECETSLKMLNGYIDSLLQDEGKDFLVMKEYLNQHGDELRIPLDYDNDPTPYDERFQRMFAKAYPGKVYGEDVQFDDLSEDLKLTYAEYFMAKWLSAFERARASFQISYLYFVYPTGEDIQVCYMIDAIRESLEVDGKEYIHFNQPTPTDKEKHSMLWEAWDTGKSPDGFDVFDNALGYTYTYYTPLYLGSEKIGLICSEIDVNQVQQDILISVLIQFVGSAFVMILCTLGILFVIRKILLLRIISLKARVTDYAEKKDPEIANTIERENVTQDEIGDLSGQFSAMILELKEYMDNLQSVTAEKERIGAELELATKIQADMLPNIFPAFPEREDFDICASMTPAKEVGGDFYDFFLIDEDHLGLVMADVSGKGVPAALFMMMSKILISNFTMIAGPDASPAKVLEQVNDTICSNNKEDMFVTVWLGIVTLSTGRCVAANAGHEYPMLRKADGQFEIFKDPHGFVIGGMEGMIYTEYEFTLEKGGTLFLYTDGVPEATNANNELYEMDRALAALNQAPDASPKELLANVKADIDRFNGDAPQFDDLTMLAIKLLK